MTHRFPFSAVSLLAVVSLAAAAAAQNKCDAGKLKCVRGKLSCLVKVHEIAQKKGLPADAATLQTCMDKFDGGAVPEKGCFAKLEAKQDAGTPGTTCSQTGDTATAEADVDAYVDSLLALLATPTPPSASNKCDAGRLKCVRAKLGCLVKVQEIAQKKGLSPDPTKRQKCMDKFDGGAVPARGCFAKLEAKQDGTKPETQCAKTGDTVAVEADVDAYADALLGLLGITPASTTSTTTTTTTGSTATTTTMLGVDCEFAGYPTCGGTCPGTDVCRPVNYPNLPYTQCQCAPDTACQCGAGANCPSGQVCQWFVDPNLFSCTGQPATCGSATTTTTTTLPCGGGGCPAGYSCLNAGGLGEFCGAFCSTAGSACPGGVSTCQCFPDFCLCFAP